MLTIFNLYWDFITIIVGLLNERSPKSFQGEPKESVTILDQSMGTVRKEQDEN